MTPNPSQLPDQPHDVGERRIEAAGRADVVSVDPLDLGVLIGNAIWAAVNGPRGEFRKERQLVGSGESGS